MRTEAEVIERAAGLIALRSQVHSGRPADLEMETQLGFQIAEQQWVLGKMEASGGGILLPVDQATWMLPIEMADYEQDMEARGLGGLGSAPR